MNPSKNILFAIICFIHLLYVSSRSVNQIENKIDDRNVNRVPILVMKWGISANKNEEIKAFGLCVLGFVSCIATGYPNGTIWEVNHLGKKIYKNKLQITYEQNKDDQQSGIVRLSVVDPKAQHWLTLRTIFEVKKGKTKFCASDIPSKLYFTKDTHSTIRTSLCGTRGRPKPIVSWKLDSLNAQNITSTSIDDNTFNYNITLPYLNHTYCGRYLNIEMVGYGFRNKQVKIERRVELRMKAHPPVIKNIHVLYQQNCYIITWNRASIGECAIKYKIQFTQDNETLLTAITANSTFTICDKNATNVRVWSIYDGIEGNKSDYKRLLQKESIIESVSTIKMEFLFASTVGCFSLLAILSIISYIIILRRRKQNHKETLDTYQNKETTHTKCCPVFGRSEVSTTQEETQFTTLDVGVKQLQSNEYYNFSKDNIILESNQPPGLPVKSPTKYIYTDLHEVKTQDGKYSDLKSKNVKVNTVNSEDSYVALQDTETKTNCDRYKDDIYDDVRQCEHEETSQQNIPIYEVIPTKL